jgi:hypothetical protein
MHRRTAPSCRAMRALFPLVLALASMSGLAAEPRLPDTLGFSLGMSAPDTVQRMRQLSLTITPAETNPFNVLDKPLLHSLTGQRQGATTGSDERIVAELTTPPTAQMVWRVLRTSSYPPQARPTVVTVVTGLRDKYGPELWRDVDGAGHVRHMRWLFDERGNAMQGEEYARLARGCNIAGLNATSFNVPAAQRDPCNGVVHLTVVIQALRQPGVADMLDIQLVNAPLAARFFPAADQWLQEQRARAAGQQIERVQQQGVKPVL